MKMNDKGKELYEVWEQNYYKENDKLGGNSAEGDFVEGWCIIDNYDYIHTLNDECGLWLFGYDDNALSEVEDRIEKYGEDDICVFNYTFGDLRREMLKYFD